VFIVPPPACRRCYSAVIRLCAATAVGPSNERAAHTQITTPPRLLTRIIKISRNDLFGSTCKDRDDAYRRTTPVLVVVVAVVVYRRRCDVHDDACFSRLLSASSVRFDSAPLLGLREIVDDNYSYPMLDRRVSEEINRIDGYRGSAAILNSRSSTPRVLK